MLEGGPGQDSLSGHDGDDVLKTRDGFPELSVDFGLIGSLSSCGPGNDTAELDFVDRASECERLSRADSSPRGGSTLAVTRKKVRLSRSSAGPALVLPVRCKGPRGGSCDGWIEFHSTKLRLTPAFDRVPYFAFPVPTMAAGRTKTGRFDLYPNHASVANRIRRGVLRTKVLVMTRDASGRTRTTTQRVDFLRR